MTETLCEKPARPKPWAWMAAGCAAATAIIAGLNGTHPAEALTTARVLRVASWTITLTYVYSLAHINDRLAWTAIGTAAATGVATILLEMAWANSRPRSKSTGPRAGAPRPALTATVWEQRTGDVAEPPNRATRDG